MEPIHVTGATGYIGRRFVRAMAAAAPGSRIVAIVRDAAAVPAELRTVPGVEFVKADLGDAGTLAAPLEGCRTVVHLAAATGKARRKEHFRVNADATAALLAAARTAGATAFLHVSTISAAFADRRHYPYAQSKLRAEELVRGAGVPFTIVRPTVVLGPGSAVLEGLSKLALLPVTPLFGGGRAKLQPIDVADVVAALVEIVVARRFRGETIDLGGPEVVTTRDLLARIRALRGKGALRGLRFPLGLPRVLLAAVEPLLLPVLPLTAGQLCPFANDGTAAPSEFVSSRKRPLRGLDESLREALARG